jgi:hypothetical protein
MTHDHHKPTQDDPAATRAAVLPRYRQARGARRVYVQVRAAGRREGTRSVTVTGFTPTQFVRWLRRALDERHPEHEDR